MGSSYTDQPRDMLFINQNWLDKLGLAYPRTFDDLENVLKAKVEKEKKQKEQKQKAKEKAARAKSYELQGPKTLLKNGWFAFALCPIFIIGAIVALWFVGAFL